MGFTPRTRTGCNLYEVVSALQNAIRKGDFEVAGYAAWEMVPQYTAYLRKRLLVISAEDCFGILTKDVLPLCELGDEDVLTKAVYLLCEAKKNRDADYFVCNLMIPTDMRDGTDVNEVAKQLCSAIRSMDVGTAGRLSMWLFQKNRKALWKILVDMTRVYYPWLLDEILALQKANGMMSKPGEETIFVAKAIVLMWTEREESPRLLAHESLSLSGTVDPGLIAPPKKAEECARMDGHFPDWAYNWHTVKGKYELKRDVVHAIENDQQLLTPLEENLFDDCTWNRDINACLRKWNPHKHQLPYNDGKRDPAEKWSKGRASQ